jgi:hypothetical protein
MSRRTLWMLVARGVVAFINYIDACGEHLIHAAFAIGRWTDFDSRYEWARNSGLIADHRRRRRF